MLESSYKDIFLDKVRALLPDTDYKKCVIIKNDAGYLQGVPDYTVFYGSKWATLEIKRTKHAHKRPNQQYYVDIMRNMGYSSFVYPENEQQVLMELIEHFKGETNNDME